MTESRNMWKLTVCISRYSHFSENVWSLESLDCLLLFLFYFSDLQPSTNFSKCSVVWVFIKYVLIFCPFVWLVVNLFSHSLLPGGIIVVSKETWRLTRGHGLKPQHFIIFGQDFHLKPTCDVFIKIDIFHTSFPVAFIISSCNFSCISGWRARLYRMNVIVAAVVS